MIKRLIYNIVFILFFVFSSPYYFWKMWRRGNWRRKFFERFGFYSDAFKESIRAKPTVWFHAVSVGEVNICVRLVRELLPIMKGFKVVVSTTTSTGMDGLVKSLPQEVEKIYYPVDGFFSVRRAFNAIRPSFIVIVEAEIWPNFLWRARDTGAPVFLVNARLSERSFSGYSRFGFLFRELFGSFAAVGCQDENDKQRLVALGCPQNRVFITGNLKFDASLAPSVSKVDAKSLLSKLGIEPSAPVIIGGSTHNGEEEILGRIFLHLKKHWKNLFLILVPRHFERTGDVAAVLNRLGISYILRTEVDSKPAIEPGSIQCLLVNTTGELKDFYRCATVVFVGKSLTAEGGQNPIEPAALGKPIVFGKNMQNFAAIAKILLKREAAMQVNDESELESAISKLLQDREFADKLGKNALKVIEENSGAVDKTVSMMLKVLEEKGIKLNR
jgi:3-deoxy-D-manno-octulosonic-acid transferase